MQNLSASLRPQLSAGYQNSDILGWGTIFDFYCTHSHIPHTPALQLTTHAHVSMLQCLKAHNSSLLANSTTSSTLNPSRHPCTSRDSHMHHPDSTFQSILSGTVRSAVASCSFACSFANHQLQLEMNAKRGQYVYRVRGYSNISLTSSLGLRQTFKMQKEEYNNLRKKYLWMSRFKLMHN